MKYSILGFQQEKLIKNNLTIEDALILRQIKDMYSTASMDFIVDSGIKYMWINYSYLIEQLPIVGSKRNLMRKIEYYGNELFILRVLKHNRNGQKGNFSYIAPTQKLDELQDFDLMTESHKGYDRNDIRVMTESHNKDTSLIDSSLKDSKDLIADAIDFYSRLQSLPKVIKWTDKRKSNINARIKDYGIEEVEKVLSLSNCSDFLTGKVESNGKVFIADIDWIMNPNNFIKVLEGKYVNKSKSEPNGLTYSNVGLTRDRGMFEK